MSRPKVYPSLFDRLLANSVESDDEFYKGTPCWLWTGATDRRKQYGHVNVWHKPAGYKVRGYDGKVTIVRPKGTSKTFKAHRVMAEQCLGRKLHRDRETIQHACDQGLCINPWHFEIASRLLNSQDMQNKRHGRVRRMFKPLLDAAVYHCDPMIREKPRLKATVLAQQREDDALCPF